jgi:hypothetical protein
LPARRRVVFFVAAPACRLEATFFVDAVARPAEAADLFDATPLRSAEAARFVAFSSGM